MKLKSSVKLTTKFNIDEILGNRCLVTFIDLSSESITEEKHEEDIIIEYIYDVYQIELIKDEEYFDSNYDNLLSIAKQHEYDELASEVRLKRKQLLEDTDNYAMSDRVMSDEMKSYRQSLRDIPEQEGFPYDVIYPIKPIED